jgi:hypothetical protein
MGDTREREGLCGMSATFLVVTCRKSQNFHCLFIPIGFANLCALSPSIRDH